MPLPSWPSQVTSKPLNDQYEIAEPHIELVESPVEGGPALARPQSDTIIQKVAYSILMTPTVYYTYLAPFFMNTLVQGAGQFLVNVPYNFGPVVSCRAYLDGGRWTARVSGPVINVTFTLCIFPP